MSDEDDIEPWAVGLEPRDMLFVREFLVDLNACGAAVRSHYYITADPEACAKANSWRILRRPIILKAVAAAMEERASSLKINAKTILGEAFRCYLEAAKDRNWNAAAKFLDMAGRHVDVRAFREKFSPGGMIDDDDEADESGLSNLSLEELETLARLSRKAAGVAEPEVEAPSSLRH
jgi:hypothetical protein